MRTLWSKWISKWFPCHMGNVMIQTSEPALHLPAVWGVYTGLLDESILPFNEKQTAECSLQNLNAQSWRANVICKRVALIALALWPWERKHSQRGKGWVLAESDTDQAWLCISQQPLRSLEEGKQVMVSTLQGRGFGEQAVLMFIAFGK